MRDKDIEYPVLVEQAEDETVIVKELNWIPAQDIVVGACGAKGPQHKCSANYVHHVGNDIQSYERLTQFAETSIISPMAGVRIFS